MIGLRSRRGEGPSSLLVPECLGGGDAGGLTGREPGHEQGGEDGSAEDRADGGPGDEEGGTGGIDVVAGEEIVGEDETKEGAGEDAQADDVGGFDQEAERDDSAWETEGAQQTDLLPPLDDRAGRDDNERGDTDEEPQSHERLDQGEEAG